MEIQTFNTIKLAPVGKVMFMWTRDFKSTKLGTRIYIGDVNIMHNTARKVTEGTFDSLVELMKKNGTELLTDGDYLYTTVNDSIVQIEHPLFNVILSNSIFKVKDYLNNI